MTYESSDLPATDDAAANGEIANLQAFSAWLFLQRQGALHGELTVALLKTLRAAIDSLPDDGAAKKAWCVDAVGLLFDAVADQAVPTLAYPVWLIVRPTVRQLVLLATSGAIESLLPLVRKAAI